MDSDAAITATRIGDCCVLNVPEDLGDGRLNHLKEALLAKDFARDLRAAVFDFAALQYADSTEFRGVQKIFDALVILGIEPILAGVNPGIVMHLVQHGVRPGRLRCFLTLDDALEALGLTRRQVAG